MKIRNVSMRPSDHFFSFSWWSEPWGAHMIYTNDDTINYDVQGTTLPEQLPPTHVEVMKAGRSEGRALIFSSRRVRRG